MNKKPLCDRRGSENGVRPRACIPSRDGDGAVVLLMLLFAASIAFAQDPPTPRQIIQEVQKRQQSTSQRYEGTLEVTGPGNRVATKRWIYRRIGAFGNSKAILRFTAPAEVKGVGLLIVNHPDRASDQWMWRPAIERDQRIALQDRSTRFFGTDFSFEDLEERDVDQYDYKLLAEESGTWKIESRPRKSSQYTYSYFWVKKDNYTFVKVEAYNKKGLVRVIDYKDQELIKGIWTPRLTEVFDMTRNSHTTLKYDRVDYNLPSEGRRLHTSGPAPRLMNLAALFALTFLAQNAQNAQNFEQRGFIENQSLFYAQTAPNDDGLAVDSTLLRWEASYKFAPWFTLSGAFDGRTDSHEQTQRSARLDWDDRSTQRPALSVRRLSATIHKGKVTAEIGRQFIRWGKTDILSPTDRFAPKDYLSSVVDSDFLGVTAARLTYELEGTHRRSGLSTLVHAQPHSAVKPTLERCASAGGGDLNHRRRRAFTPEDRGNMGRAGTTSAPDTNTPVFLFDGYDNLPLFNATFDPLASTLALQRYYPELRLYGGDVAVPLTWFTVKGEAAYYTSSTPSMDEFALYVIQLERQVKEWSFVGGYAGEAVTRSSGNPLQFAPDRGFARSFVGRAGLTIDVNRSLAVETAVRAAGSFVRFEYSQGIGQHWRATGGWAWIRGGHDGFFLEPVPSQ